MSVVDVVRMVRVGGRRRMSDGVKHGGHVRSLHDFLLRRLLNHWLLYDDSLTRYRMTPASDGHSNGSWWYVVQLFPRNLSQRSERCNGKSGPHRSGDNRIHAGHCGNGNPSVRWNRIGTWRDLIDRDGRGKCIRVLVGR